MKNANLLFLLSFLVLLTSCNNQTITNYNNTIVAAHEELLKINKDFSSQYETFIGKPKSKAQFQKLIELTRGKIAEAKKPVEGLIPINDEGMRDKVLDMFLAYDNSMYVFNLKSNIITNPTTKEEAYMLFLTEFQKLKTLDDEIREIQITYAQNNNSQLR
jgi:hypothetical protein